jgi:hypothetical protein
MNKTIRSTDYETVVADGFEILLDSDKRRGPVVGLKIDPVDGAPFIVPIKFEAAKELAILITKTLLFAAPELMR